MKNILIVGSEVCIGQEIMYSDINEDNYHFYETEVFFDRNFKLNKTETFDIIFVFSKLSESSLILLKKKLNNKSKKVVYVQHIEDISIFSITDFVVYYNCVFSNYEDNVLNNFFDKIQYNKLITTDNITNINPISSVEVIKCLNGIINSNISSGRYFIGNDHTITLELFYRMILRFSDIKYPIQESIVSKNSSSDSNKKFKDVFKYKFTLLEKDILNTLRNRKKYPLLLGVFYKIDNVECVIRFVDIDNRQVGLSPIDSMKTINYYDFSFLYNIER